MATLTQPWSLQRRVLIIAVVALCTGVGVGGWSMYHAAAVIDDQVIDERVEALAKGILKSVEEARNGTKGSGFALNSRESIRAVETGIHAYQVWTNNGTVLLRSHKAPVAQSFLPVSYTGYKEIWIDGAEYCVFSTANADRSVVVQVAEPTPERAVSIELLLGKYMAVTLIPIALLLAAIRMMLQRSFLPLTKVSQNLAARSPADSSPIEVEKPPIELAPLVQSLNLHLHRQAVALEKEARFTSVAAHELRTPLAGIRAQAQVAGLAGTPEELNASLDAVMQGVDSTSRMVEQLIDLHRTEVSATTESWRTEAVKLAVLHEQLWKEFDPKAKAKRIKLDIAFDTNEMHGYEFAIWVLFRNLVGNAIQYCPVDGRVNVRLKRRDFRVVLTVDDSGPSIPEAARDQAFEKFNRLGRTGGDGVGLGLSIVANIADLHQAVLSLQESPLGGLRVEVQFHGVDAPSEDDIDEPFQITGAGSLWSAGPP